MIIITESDLTSYLRQPVETDVTVFVDLANGIVSEVTGVLATTPVRLMAITLEVAARAFRNPNGYSSETIDDYTYRRDADTRQAGVYLTAAERSELLGLAGKGGATSYSVQTISPLDIP